MTLVAFTSPKDYLTQPTIEPTRALSDYRSNYNHLGKHGEQDDIKSEVHSTTLRYRRVRHADHQHSTAARESALVIVIVSDNKTKYTVYRSLLVQHSEYFEKALTGSWMEAQQGVVMLEDVDCDACEYTVGPGVAFINNMKLKSSLTGCIRNGSRLTTPMAVQTSQTGPRS